LKSIAPIERIALKEQIALLQAENERLKLELQQAWDQIATLTRERDLALDAKEHP
jgi:hypothetical protein